MNAIDKPDNNYRESICESVWIWLIEHAIHHFNLKENLESLWPQVENNKHIALEFMWRNCFVLKTPPQRRCHACINAIHSIFFSPCNITFIYFSLWKLSANETHTNYAKRTLGCNCSYIEYFFRWHKNDYMLLVDKQSPWHIQHIGWEIHEMSTTNIS